jgi:Flp pilus assembly protein TadG
MEGRSCRECPSIPSSTPTMHGRFRDRERGAAAVEFALILPLLIVLVFGIVQFSIAYNRVQGLHAAAREGARLASLPQTTQSDIAARVTSSLAGVPLNGSPTITVTPSSTRPCENRSGLTVKVSVSAVTDLDIPIWGSVSKTLSGTGEFRCE